MHAFVFALLLTVASSASPMRKSNADLSAFIDSHYSVDFTAVAAEVPASSKAEPKKYEPPKEGRTSDVSPSPVSDAVADEVGELERLKSEILLDQAEGRPTLDARVRLYNRLIALMTSQKDVLSKEIDKIKGDLAGSSSGDEFMQNKAAIKFITSLADRLTRALDLPGSPACACGNAEVMSDPWLTEAATTNDALPMLHCIEQLRLQLYEKRCDGNERNRIERRLAWLERELYNLGVRDQKRIADIKDELTKLSYPDDQEAIDKDLKERKQLQGDVKDIKRLLVLPSEDPLILGFEDYPRHLQKFSTGVEYDAIGDFLNNGAGLPRIGYTVEMRFGGSNVSELYPGAGPSSRLGVHEIFSAFVSGSAEHSLISETTASNIKAAKKAQVAFQFEDAAFFPLSRSARFTDLESPVPPARLRWLWGPIVVFGASLGTDNSGKNNDRVDERHYVGFRETLSPFTFNDILIGRTHGLRHTRIEVRGQIPIMKLSATSRIVLGAVGNFAVRKPQRRDIPVTDEMGVPTKDMAGNPIIARGVNTEPDTIRIYLSWDANFSLPKAGN